MKSRDQVIQDISPINRAAQPTFCSLFTAAFVTFPMRANAISSAISSQISTDTVLLNYRDAVRIVSAISDDLRSGSPCSSLPTFAKDIRTSEIN